MTGIKLIYGQVVLLALVTTSVEAFISITPQYFDALEQFPRSNTTQQGLWTVLHYSPVLVFLLGVTQNYVCVLKANLALTVWNWMCLAPEQARASDKNLSQFAKHCLIVFSKASQSFNSMEGGPTGVARESGNSRKKKPASVFRGINK